MKTETSNIERQGRMEYEPARIEVIYISVEAGFAQTERPGEQIRPGDGFGDGGGGSDYEDIPWS